jgi:hypothetical protein
MAIGEEKAQCKKLILVILIAIISVTAFITASPVLAQDNNSNSKENFFVSIFHKILQKLGFEKQDTKQNQFKLPNPSITPLQSTPPATPSGEMRGKNKQQITEKQRLEKLVKDGKITEAQKTAILAELKALREKYSMESMKDLTEEERKEKTEEMQAELKAWAEEQGIDEEYVMLQPVGNNGPMPSRQPPQKGNQQIVPPEE